MARYITRFFTLRIWLLLVLLGGTTSALAIDPPVRPGQRLGRLEPSVNASGPDWHGGVGP